MIVEFGVRTGKKTQLSYDRRKKRFMECDG